MPNWVTNSVLISGPAEELVALREKLKIKPSWWERDDEPVFSFDNIVPTQLDDDVRDLWGTKWDACHAEDRTDENENDNQLQYSFDTAWSVPMPVYEALAKQYPNLEIDVEFDEESGWFGSTLLKNGELERFTVIEPICHQDWELNDRVCPCGYSQGEDVPDGVDSYYEDCPGYKDPED